MLKGKKGVRRQPQVASAARTAVQQVPVDVISVLMHPPQRAVGAGSGGGGTRLDIVTPGGDGSKEGGAWCARRGTEGTRGPRASLALLHRSSATVRAGRCVRTCRRVPR
jgi:hypothetical protein